MLLFMPPIAWTFKERILSNNHTECAVRSDRNGDRSFPAPALAFCFNMDGVIFKNMSGRSDIDATFVCAPVSGIGSERIFMEK